MMLNLVVGVVERRLWALRQDRGEVGGRACRNVAPETILSGETTAEILKHGGMSGTVDLRGFSERQDAMIEGLGRK
jgi:hypothetical protein